MKASEYMGHQRNPERRPVYWKLVDPAEFAGVSEALTAQMIGTIFGRTFILTEEHPDGSGRDLYIEGRNKKFVRIVQGLPENTASSIEFIEAKAEMFFNWEGLAWITFEDGTVMNLTGYSEGEVEIYQVRTVVFHSPEGFRIKFMVDDRELGKFECPVDQVFRVEHIVEARRRMLDMLKVDTLRKGLAARHNGKPLDPSQIAASIAKDGKVLDMIKDSFKAGIIEDQFRKATEGQDPQRN
jgi:hypothetical protein